MKNMTAVTLGMARVATTAGYIGAAFSAIIVMAMVALVISSIVARNLFGTSITFTTEFVGYGVAAATFNSLAYAMNNNFLIKVSLLDHFTRGKPKLGKVVDAVTIILTFLPTVLAAEYFWKSIIRHYTRGTVSPTGLAVPMWLPEGLMLIGILIFCFALISRLALLISGVEANEAVTNANTPLKMEA